MQQSLAQPQVKRSSRRRDRFSAAGLDESSPFGLQGLMRDSLRILNQDAIGQLAFALAVRGTRKQIRDTAFVESVLANRPDWMTEFRIVHLVEKSLWINGQSDLVMTMTPNPSQIPDNPPPQVTDLLTRAYGLHPQGTVWYGVPCFSDEKNAEGLPIPLTAADVRREHLSRLQTAQVHALRWRWFYRARLHGPAMVKRMVMRTRYVAQQIGSNIAGTIRQARKDVKRREQAQHCAYVEYIRTGRCSTEIPEHTTALGQYASVGLSSAGLAYRLLRFPAAAGAMGFIPFGIASTATTLFPVVVPIIPLDPFLFIELPGEPGKLRFLGHWYWQRTDDQQEKLHLHI